MDSAALKYALHVSIASYTGDAGEMFDGGSTPAGDHNGMMFTANIILMMMPMTMRCRCRCDADDEITVMMFSAKDQDNDLHAGVQCAQFFAGGWWYNSCFFFDPTGSNPQYWGFCPSVLQCLSVSGVSVPQYWSFCPSVLQCLSVSGVSVPQYWGFVEFGIAGSQVIQKVRMMMKIAD